MKTFESRFESVALASLNPAGRQTNKTHLKYTQPTQVMGWLRRSSAVLAAALAGFLAHSSFMASQRVEAPLGTYAQLPQQQETESAETPLKRFRSRPSDGGSLEYFEYGSNDPGAAVWLFIHGAVSTGGMLNIFPGFEAEMRAMNVRVIAPTMPGWGTSDPYPLDGSIFDISGSRWLKQWAQDSLALMDFLNVSGRKFAVSGMSLGGGPGLATAAIAQKEGRLLAFAPLIALTWNAADQPGQFNLESHYSFGKRLGMALLYNPYLGSLFAETMRDMILGTDEEGFENNPMVPPDVTWDRSVWGRDMQRSVKYQLAGQVQSNRVPVSSSPEAAIDFAVFDRSVPVFVFFGEQDDVVVPSVATFTAEKLPWAQLRPFPGSHFDLDLSEVARTLFPAQKKAIKR
jgi:pimeloyl-ACP methyl ester carboxylesterase